MPLFRRYEAPNSNFFVDRQRVAAESDPGRRMWASTLSLHLESLCSSTHLRPSSTSFVVYFRCSRPTLHWNGKPFAPGKGLPERAAAYAALCGASSAALFTVVPGA